MLASTITFSPNTPIRGTAPRSRPRQGTRATRLTCHQDPPPYWSAPRLTRAFTRARAAHRPSTASGCCSAATPRSVHACGSVTLRPAPLAQTKTSAKLRRLTYRISSSRPVSGWNRWVTTSEPNSSLDDAALCEDRREAQAMQLTVRLRTHPCRRRLNSAVVEKPFPYRNRGEAAALQRRPQPVEEDLDALRGHDLWGSRMLVRPVHCPTRSWSVVAARARRRTVRSCPVGRRSARNPSRSSRPWTAACSSRTRSGRRPDCRGPSGERGLISRPSMDSAARTGAVLPGSRSRARCWMTAPRRVPFGLRHAARL